MVQVPTPNIPNTKGVPEFFRSEKPPVGAPARLLTISFLFMLAAVLIYLGLSFGYQPFLGSRIKNIDQQLQQLSGTVSKADQEKFVRFYSQLVNFRKILDSHVSFSGLLPLLEKITNQKVYYSSMDLKVKDGQLVLDGVAASYAVLAEQLTSFGNNVSVEKYNLSQSQFSDGRVQFKISLTLKPEVFK